jgi:hypothetical protein
LRHTGPYRTHTAVWTCLPCPPAKTLVCPLHQMKARSWIPPNVSVQGAWAGAGKAKGLSRYLRGGQAVLALASNKRGASLGTAMLIRRLRSTRAPRPEPRARRSAVEAVSAEFAMHATVWAKGLRLELSLDCPSKRPISLVCVSRSGLRLSRVGSLRIV